MQQPQPLQHSSGTLYLLYWFVQLFCQGGQRTAKALAASLITLQQCGNAAFGECQRLAKDSRQSPCGFAFNGYQQCKKADFEGFYNGELLLLLCTLCVSMPLTSIRRLKLCIGDGTHVLHSCSLEPKH